MHTDPVTQLANFRQRRTIESRVKRRSEVLVPAFTPCACVHSHVIMLPYKPLTPGFSFISLASHLSCLAGKTWPHWSTEQPPWTCQRGVLDVGWQWGSPPRPLQASQGAVCRPSTCSHPATPSMAPAWHMKSCSWCPHHSSSASTPSSQPCLRY